MPRMKYILIFLMLNCFGYASSANVFINEYQNNNLFSIFPNPFSSTTTLRTDKNFKDATLIVYNLFGQEVKEMKNISGQSITLQRDNLPSGLYFIRLMQDNKIIATDKLVVSQFE